MHKNNNYQLSDYKAVPIIKKSIDLYKLYYSFLLTFPKANRYTLGAHIEKIIIEILELLLKANILPKTEKLPIIESANNKFELLKVFIRLTRELKVLDNKKYLRLQELIMEIGKMFGGWIKSLK